MTDSAVKLGAGQKIILVALLAALVAMFAGSFLYRMQGGNLVVQLKPERGGMGQSGPGGPGGMGGMGGAMGGLDMDRLRGLMQAVEKNPNDPAALLELGNTFMMMQAWDKAQQYLDKAAKVAPGDARVLRAQGMVHFERKEYPPARKAFEAVLKKEPDDVLAHYNLGILLKHYMQQPAEADAHFRKVLQLGASDPEVLKSAEEELAAGGKK